MKKISVIIPCYNSEKYVRKCLDSVVNQTIGIESLQVILVDDASTDGTLNVLHEYEHMYPESILVIECTENGRQGTARNIGMRHAEADYIGFIDSDDWVDLTMYEKLYAKAVKHDCDMVYCNAKWVHGESSGPYDVVCEDGFVEINCVRETKEFALSGNCPIAIWIKIYKKSLVFENGVFFPEKLAGEDSFFGPVMHYFVNRVGSISGFLYFYSLDCPSTTRVHNKSHILDILIVEMMKIDFFKEKGLFGTYRRELEYDFIRTFYIVGLKRCITSFDDLPIEIIKEMRETLLMLFPTYKSNPYLNSLKDLEKILLSVADIEIGENYCEELNKIANMYKSVHHKLYGNVKFDEA